MRRSYSNGDEMRNKDITIRYANPADAESLLAIYAPYVLHTAITFELEVPSVSEFRTRISHTLEKYPYLVAALNGEILGYAYLGEFKGRAAYTHSAEVSVYVRMDSQRNGIGRQLYSALDNEAKQRGILNLNACIAYAETEDDFLSQSSVCFHERMGYTQCAHFHKCARKFGRWYDMIWMEKLFDRSDS